MSTDDAGAGAAGLAAAREEAGEAAVLADLLLLFAADGARLAGDAARRLRSVRPPRLEESSAS